MMRTIGMLVGMLLLVTPSVYGAGPAPGPTALEAGLPVNLEAGANTLRLSVIGRYDSEFFDLSSISPPAYDPGTGRLFVPMNDLGWVEVLDIRDPAHPQRVARLLTAPFGGSPYSVDVKQGIVAVTLVNPIKGLPGAVVFFDVSGDRIGGPVRVGVQPVQLAFTPDGRYVVVANEGEANEEYTVDPEGSISRIDLGPAADRDCHTQHCTLDPAVNTIHFTGYNPAREALRAAGVRLYGPGATVAQDMEPESVAIAPDGQTAWVILQRNNAVAVVDVPSAQLTALVPLGYKDHGLPGNGFDASDVDGVINIQNWPVRSFYEPDLVAPFQVGGALYLVTANEGDPRDFSGYSEVRRVSELRLDPASFPNAAQLQQASALGRLRVTQVDGDSTQDGWYEHLYMLGSRSFAIWTRDWQLVFDSGDQLERITARAVPQFFNSADDQTRFDQKSDERGPEPEALAVGQVGWRQYVFVAPERIGGVYVFDITHPAAPVFQQYINYRNFAIDPAAVCQKNALKSADCARAGDLGPEGMVFIAAAHSPIGVPLVALTNEVSGSTTLYRVDPHCPNDRDCDGIPDTVEVSEGTNPDVKDNDLFTHPRLFAMQQYRDVLRREGDPGGIDFWTQQLVSGPTDRAALADTFLSSPEFEGHVAPIVRLYQAYFLRLPDYDGLWYWVGQVSAGTPLSAVSQAFADASEFLQRYGNLDCGQFVSLVYQNVLARNPDPDGGPYWTGQCNSGLSRGAIMLGFADSPEYQAQQANRVLVVLIYAGMLQRDPDPAGAAYWLGQLEQGLSRQALINAFLTVPEYRQRFLP